MINTINTIHTNRNITNRNSQYVSFVSFTFILTYTLRIIYILVTIRRTIDPIFVAIIFYLIQPDRASGRTPRLGSRGSLIKVGQAAETPSGDITI